MDLDWGYLKTGCLGEYLGPKRDEVTGGWRKLHNEDLHSFTLHPVLLGSSRQGG
jgi:hypothetical protein